MFDAKPGAVGQCFARDLKKDKELCHDYKGLVGRAAKAAFRQRWAQSRMEAASRACTKEEKHTFAEEAAGQYLPFKRIWELEGADKAGFQAITKANKARNLAEAGRDSEPLNACKTHNYKPGL